MGLKIQTSCIFICCFLLMAFVGPYVMPFVEMYYSLSPFWRTVLTAGAFVFICSCMYTCYSTIFKVCFEGDDDEEERRKQEEAFFYDPLEDEDDDAIEEGENKV